jgi:hypothetical protein
MGTFRVLQLTAVSPLPPGPKNAPPYGNLFFRTVNEAAELPANISDERVAAIVAIFNTGRDCFYDTKTLVFSTDPSIYPNIDMPRTGTVAGWDAIIPTAGTAVCQLRLLLQQDGDRLPTSYVFVPVQDVGLALALAVVRSTPCYFDGTSLIAFELPEAQ